MAFMFAGFHIKAAARVKPIPPGVNAVLLQQPYIPGIIIHQACYASERFRESQRRGRREGKHNGKDEGKAKAESREMLSGIRDPFWTLDLSVW